MGDEKLFAPLRDGGIFVDVKSIFTPRRSTPPPLLESLSNTGAVTARTRVADGGPARAIERCFLRPRCRQRVPAVLQSPAIDERREVTGT